MNYCHAIMQLIGTCIDAPGAMITVIGAVVAAVDFLLRPSTDFNLRYRSYRRDRGRAILPSPECLGISPQIDFESRGPWQRDEETQASRAQPVGCAHEARRTSRIPYERFSMSNNQSLPLTDVLLALRQDIQAEDTLIASRLTGYVTSQAFLLTAYATSWGAGFEGPNFFHTVLPLAAVILSAVIFASIYAATWARDVYPSEQAALVARIQADIPLSPSETVALQVYERTMVANRQDESGRIVGGRIHAQTRTFASRYQ